MGRACSYWGLLGLAGILAVAPINPSEAATKVKFECRNQNGTPTTVGISSQWNNQARALIRWYNDVGQNAGYTPAQRCSEVSNRLNDYFAGGAQYITYGFMGGNPVVCTTNKLGDGCNNLLFTLDGRKFGWQGTWKQEPKDLLKSLVDLGDNNISGNPLIQTSCVLSIDVKAVLTNKTIKASCN